jgi:hypothetical protein
MPIQNLLEPGRKFGTCVVTRLLPAGKCRIYCYECKRYKVVWRSNLHKLQSCGCKQVELRTRKITIHGHSAGRNFSPTYRRYRAMHDRCECPSSSTYFKYGAKGVQVSPLWSGKQGFVNFLADMGEIPSPKHSLSRLLDLGNYEPGNVVWGTSAHQRRQARLKRKFLKGSLGNKSDRRNKTGKVKDKYE